MPATQRRPLGPAMQAFYDRLEPELSIDDLDTRATNAAAILTTAIAQGKDELAGKALTRLLERWQQREDLQLAPAWLWSQRADTMTAMFGAITDEHPLAEAITQQFYTTIARASGEDRDNAEAYGYRQMRQWQRTRPGAVRAEELYS